MALRRTMLMACLTTLGVAALAQEAQRPIDTSVIRSQTLSDAQTRQLSTTIGRRAAERSLVVNPDAIRNAGVEAAPVDVSGSEVVPSDAPNKPEPAPAPQRAKIEFIQTSARDEVLLQRALASQTSLQPALNLEASSLITLPGVVRMATASGPDLQLKPFILVNQPLERAASGLFEGELLVGVAEIVDSGVTQQLPTPLLFQIVGAVKSTPERIVVDTTSPPFQRVRVTVKALQNRAAELLVVSVIDRKGTKISLPLTGELRIETASAASRAGGWPRRRSMYPSMAFLTRRSAR